MRGAQCNGWSLGLKLAKCLETELLHGGNHLCQRTGVVINFRKFAAKNLKYMCNINVVGNLENICYGSIAETLNRLIQQWTRWLFKCWPKNLRRPKEADKKWNECFDIAPFGLFRSFIKHCQRHVGPTKQVRYETTTKHKQANPELWPHNANVLPS